MTTHVRFESLLLSVKLCFVTLHIIFSCKLRGTDVACEVFLVIFCHYNTYGSIYNTTTKFSVAYHNHRSCSLLPLRAR